MNKTLRYLLSVILGCFLLSACNSEKVEPEPNRLGYDFFPLETGNFVEYDVQETYYALTANPIIRTYQIKEIIGDSFLDLSNEAAYQVMRYSRPEGNAAWQLDSIWVAKRTPNQAIRIENNIAFVKLIFPVEEKQTWNGNVLNNLGNDEYQLLALNKPYKVTGAEFDNTLTIVQNVDSSLVNQDKRTEIYAQGVGLVYKERVQVQFCSSTAACLGKGQIDFGVKFYQRLKTYGRN
jgi:hypothetical protein